MDEQVTARLEEMGVTEEDLQNPEKVKELAETIEAENKAKAEEAPADDKILKDQTGRLMKALTKNLGKETTQEAPAVATLSELDVDNRVFARAEGLSEKQIAILKEYSTLPKNEGKSLESIYKTSAVQAEMKDLQSELDAIDEIDTNANSEKQIHTKNEIYDNYTKSGEEPKTEYEQKIVADKRMEDAGFPRYV